VVIGRSGGSVRHHHNKYLWRDRKAADKKEGERERPGAWLTEKIRYRVAKSDSYLLAGERRAALQAGEVEAPAESVDEPLEKPEKSEKPVMRVDRFAAEIMQDLANADVRTKEGILSVISGSMQTFKDAIIEGRANITKTVDFERLARLRNEIIHGAVAGSGNVTINIITAVPRPTTGDVPEAKATPEIEVVEADYQEVEAKVGHDGE